MAARTYYPACTVTINDIDVTPFLGEGGYVTTAKDLYSPKGRWEVVIPDKPLRDGGDVVDSLYGMIAPMQRVVIRMARNAHQYRWGQPPAVMRGFVREIVRDESIGEDGRPNRFVRIAGDDYGCIGELVQIRLFYEAAIQPALPLMRFITLGINQSIMPAAQYMETLLEKAINEQLRKMTVETGDMAIAEIQYDGQVTAGNVTTQALTSHEGTVWKLMFDQADTPWNELYIEDRDAALGDEESAPVLVYRPTPWRDLDDAYIENTGQAINAGKVRVITPDEGDSDPEFKLVRAATYRRSDEQVNNIYWVHPVFIGIAPEKLLAYALSKNTDGVHFLDYPNADVDIYGPRILMIPTRQFPDGVTPYWSSGGGTNEEKEKILDLYSQWATRRRKWLTDANKDNVLRDEGALTVRGNEKLRIGSYYVINRGQFQCAHYLTQVSHTFAPYREFTTHVTFIRADNYYLRDKWRKSGRSPFLAEGRKGVLEK